MTEYETIFITNAGADATVKNAVTDKVKAIFSKAEANILGLRDWGVRKMAYEIQKSRRGHYYYVSYLGAGKVVPELEQALRFDENVLRYHTVRVGSVENVEERLAEAKRHEESLAKAAASKPAPAPTPVAAAPAEEEETKEKKAAPPVEEPSPASEEPKASDAEVEVKDDE